MQFQLAFIYVSISGDPEYPCTQIPELSPPGRGLQELPRLLQRGHREVDQRLILLGAVHRQGTASG